MVPSCVSDCRRNHITSTCFADHTTDCNGFSQCALVPICGGKLGTGTGTCAQAWACQTTCTPGDITCGCNCAANLRYQSLARLFAVDICLANCGYRQPCMQNSCGGYINRCNAN